jgi:hypothetical protein
MNSKERQEVRQELEALAIDYWYEVDFNWGQQAHAFYTADAEFTTSLKTRRGHQEIRDFYHARQARGARTSLHVVQNFRVGSIAVPRVDVNYIMSLYAADGEGVQPSKPAIMVADVRETLVRQPDGSWLYSARTLKPLFRDDTPTTG